MGKIIIKESELRKMIDESIHSAIYNIKNRPYNYGKNTYFHHIVDNDKWESYFNKIAKELNSFIRIYFNTDFNEFVNKCEHDYDLKLVWKDKYPVKQENGDVNKCAFFTTGDKLIGGERYTSSYYDRYDYGDETLTPLTKQGILVTYNQDNIVKDIKVSIQ